MFICFPPVSPPHLSPCPRCCIWNTVGKSNMTYLQSDFLFKRKTRDCLHDVLCFILNTLLPQISLRNTDAFRWSFSHVWQICSPPPWVLCRAWHLSQCVMDGRWPDPWVVPKVSRGKRSEWTKKVPFSHWEPPRGLVPVTVVLPDWTLLLCGLSSVSVLWEKVYGWPTQSLFQTWGFPFFSAVKTYVINARQWLLSHYLIS